MNFKKLVSMLLVLACAFTFAVTTPGIDLSALTTSAAMADSEELLFDESDASGEIVFANDYSDEVIQSGGFPKQKPNAPAFTALGNADAQNYLSINTALRSRILTAWNNLETEVFNISAYNVTLQDVKDTYYSTLNANPSYFYIFSGFRYATNSSTGKVSYLQVQYNYSTSAIPGMISKFNTETNKILSQVNSGWTATEKALFIHDYIATHNRYDDGLNNYNAYNVIVDRTAVCQGIAHAYKHLMDKLGVRCEVVTSDINDHAWNIVLIDGAWYHVDATWDDPTRPDILGLSLHENFLKTEAELIANGHKPGDWTVNASSAMGVATSTKFSNFFWNNVMTAIPGVGHKWYYYNPNGVIYAYDFSTKTTSAITTAANKWYAWGSTSSYYKPHQVSNLVALNNRIFYTTPTSIVSMNANGTDKRTEYTLTSTQKSQGYIYALIRNGNSLTYYLKQDPTGAVKASGTVTPQTVTAPAKPVVKAFAGNGAIKLSWNKVPGATSYRIYQYVNGNYVTIANTSGTAYTKSGLKNGTTYKFLVRAYNGSTWSPFTAADLVSVKPVAPLAKPAVKAFAGNGAIKLSWNKVPGAISYRIFQYVNGNYITVANTTGTSYTKAGLKNGVTYRYLVRAYDGTTWSTYTTADLVSVKPVAPLAKPVVSAFSGNGAIKLSWNKVAGATGYRVYQYVNGNYVTVANTSGTSYTRTGLTNGATYKFLVRAYNSTTWSNYTTADLITVKPSALSRPTVNAFSGNGAIKLSWNKVSGATGYRVYQYVNGTYVTLTTTTGTSFTKTGLKNGYNYTFLVRAYNSDGWSSYTTADLITVKPMA